MSMSKMEDYQKKLKQWQNKTLEQTEKSILRHYRKLLKEMLAEIGEIYSKYETNGVITRLEMAKYDRLTKFLDSLIVHVNRMSKQAQDTVEEYLRDSYVYSYYWMAYAVETTALVTVGYAALAPSIVEAALNNPVRGLTLHETLEKNRRDIIYTIRNTTARGLTNGMTYKQMADEISKVIKKDEEKAIRIARTEGHRVTHQAEMDSMIRAKQKGIISTKTWKNSKDERVRRRKKGKRADHWIIGDQEVEVDEMFDLKDGRKGLGPGNTGYADHDINCRCFLVYDVKVVEARTNDELAQVTFEDWKKVIKV